MKSYFYTVSRILALSFFLFLGFFFTNISHAQADTLYFNAGTNTNWNTLTNWWTNGDFAAGHEALTLPSIGDDVIISGNVFSNSGSPASVNTMTVNGSTLFSIPVTVAGGAIFNGTSHNSNTISGDATFNNSALNYGNIVGDAIFYNTSINYQTVTGNATFNDTSFNYGTVTIDATFTYATGGTINLTGSQIWGIVDGVPKDVDGNPIIHFIFHNSSRVGNFSPVPGDATFYDSSSSQQGIVSGDATFYNSSENEGTVSGDATFHNSSIDGGTVSGDATFYDSSWGAGIFAGRAIFYDDLTEDYGTVSPAKIRHYITDTVTSRDFVPNGPWTVIADGVVVNITTANYNSGTIFHTLNGGSFIPSNPVPTLTSISPSSATVGDSGFILTATGADFIDGAVINWNGSPKSTTFVSGSELNAAIDSSYIASVGTVNVTVTNPGPGGGTSGSQTFTIFPITHTLTYAADVHGTISGTTPQTVNDGEDGTEVTAVANTGYHFTTWSDAVTTAARTDTDVTGDISVTASFEANPKSGGGVIGGGGVYTPPPPPPPHPITLPPIPVVIPPPPKTPPVLSPPQHLPPTPVIVPPISNPGSSSSGTTGTNNTNNNPASSSFVNNTIKSIIISARNVTNDPTVKTVGDIATAIPVTVSLFVLIASFLSGIPFLNYLFYLLVVAAQLLGFTKKPKPWGTVYDSRTKRPLPFARVEILNEQSRKLQSTITDANGRYGFLISSQLPNIQLRAYLTKYDFPSNIEPSVVEQKLYPNIYKGGFIGVLNNFTNSDLPMDPRDKSSLHNFYFGISSIKLNNILTKTANVLFVAGVIFGLTNSILNPSINNFAILAVILLTFVLRTSGFKLKPFGLTKDRETNKVLPFGFIALHNQNGERISFTVSDDSGRYFLLTPKGNYLLKAYTPAQVLPTRTKEVPVSTNKGWISKEINV